MQIAGDKRVPACSLKKGFERDIGEVQDGPLVTSAGVVGVDPFTGHSTCVFSCRT